MRLDEVMVCKTCIMSEARSPAEANHQISITLTN